MKKIYLLLITILVSCSSPKDYNIKTVSVKEFKDFINLKDKKISIISNTNSPENISGNINFLIINSFKKFRKNYPKYWSVLSKTI